MQIKKSIIRSAAASLLIIAGSAIAAEPASHVIVRPGDVPSVAASAKNFTGEVRHESIARPSQESPYSVSTVTFEPGARTFWHTHPAGQRLIVLSGFGLVGTPDGRTEAIRPGDIVWCPPGLRHWHGASGRTAMSHIAITNVKDGRNVEWLEPVSEEDYARAAAAHQK